MFSIVFRSSIMSAVKATLLFLSILFLTGCDFDYLLFDPKGPIGEEQKHLIINSFLIMLIVVIPVIVMTVWFSLKYRDTNEGAEYEPEWHHSNKIEFWAWTVPCLIILTLGYITFITSHSLDPRKVIDSGNDNPVLQVQVVALDWKWLFIYPEYEIATVNEMAMPVNTTVEFLVTSDTVMNAFFIPQLGSMIYAMAGMENRLHLLADEPGKYAGASANYSGYGYSGMKFTAHAVDQAGFDAWVQQVKSSSKTLDNETFKALAKKSRNNPAEYFKLGTPLLFNSIVEKYTGPQK